MYEKIRESFLDELSEYYSNGQMPSHASINMRRALTEHSDRLRKKGVKYRPRFLSTIDERPGETTFSSNSFTTCTCYKHCNSIFEYTDGHTTLKCDETTDDVVYFQVIDRKDAGSKTRSEDQIIICPNCGHRAPATGFVDGCPMCSTKFEVKNVFPCVNSYYSMIWPMPKKNFAERGMKIETITKDYRLTEEAIDSIAEETESFLYSVGIERANIFRIRLSLEEALLRWMDHFGTGAEVRFSTGV